MSNNYTPVNREELEKKFGQSPKKNSSVDTILLLIGTLTAIVLAFLLFVLIQKKMQATQSNPTPTVTVMPPTIPPTNSPAGEPSPTIILTTTITPPVATPSATLSASGSATLTPSPTTVATPSATQAP